MALVGRGVLNGLVRALQRAADLVDLTKEMPVLRGAVPEQDLVQFGHDDEKLVHAAANVLEPVEEHHGEGIGGEDIPKLLAPALVLLHEAAHDRPDQHVVRVLDQAPHVALAHQAEECVRLEHLPHAKFRIITTRAGSHGDPEVVPQDRVHARALGLLALEAALVHRASKADLALPRVELPATAARLPAVIAVYEPLLCALAPLLLLVARVPPGGPLVIANLKSGLVLFCLSGRNKRRVKKDEDAESEDSWRGGGPRRGRHRTSCRSPLAPRVSIARANAKAGETKVPRIPRKFPENRDFYISRVTTDLDLIEG